MARKFRITYNAPVILTFTLAAVAVHILSDVFGEQFKLAFVAHPQFSDWRSYLGLISHILGHANWDHLLGNFTMILLLGPILEERHGSGQLLIMILLTALVTGLINVMFLSTGLLGASGIVFMLILLASTANIKHGEIPLTFIAVAVIYLGGEVVRAFQDNHISQMAHLVGGLAGAVYGFALAGVKSDSGKRMLERAKPGSL